MKALFSVFLLLSAVISFAQDQSDTVQRKHVQFIPLPKDAVKIFPNPVANDLYVTVRMEDLRIRAVFIYDKDGNRVLEHRVNTVMAVPLKLNLSTLPAGKYYLVIETNQQPVRMQLMKQ